ncbi:cytochrome c oxidase assembly factor 6 homolog [Pollicipes pollicipes]|uniref:cytochrome c oxidase assembly factor 6 homolog n=1 Tax=Pollicipes pollicipes TaxID=41117 RepID=UPI0018855040|nr:cytochrome c oxidase assembly factor 6 homolog [Pollicipes pollicipes]XP_037081994.1 cytochrome c oxidase assembly factor 6 homolog [Pollicipes pollicipes]
MSFPDKAARQVCWDARDQFWACLDTHGEDATPCKHLRQLYEKGCPSSWVKHFDRKRSYLKFKDKIQNEGLEVAAEPAPVAPAPLLSAPPAPSRRHRVYRELVPP